MAIHRHAAGRVPRQVRHRSAPVVTSQLAERGLWVEALRLAGGNSRLLVVEGARRVRVKDARYEPPR